MPTNGHELLVDDHSWAFKGDSLSITLDNSWLQGLSPSDMGFNKHFVNSFCIAADFQ